MSSIKIKLAMLGLDLQFSFDEFRQRKYVQGYALQEYQGELTDDLCAALRNLVLERFGFDPGRDHTRDALNMYVLNTATTQFVIISTGLSGMGRRVSVSCCQDISVQQTRHLT